MPLVSILTITHPAGSGFIIDAMESVRSQDLPAGWDLEWVVQEDGPRTDLGERLAASFDRVRYDANGGKLGIGLTRNLALTRASGSLVQNLDSDDLLLPGALAALIPVFDDPTIHWAIGQADDLLPDGSRKSFPAALSFGRVPAGSVTKWAEAHGANWPIHCAGLLHRTASLRALGGWGGVPFDDDIVLFAALSEISDGHFDERLTWLYRQHPQQSIRDPRFRQWGDVGRRIAIQRAAAARVSGLKIAEAGVDPNPHVEIGPAIKETVDIEVR
jgi:glycosyltransferase involved in cell wall biosynthesis